ncbi:ABC transporter ATP-binding protein [Paludicola sp. MB14-C6]|uniref:ABC transporter ATP-binding protein n=1 Tax=Paludihabitans sp. MB14-C6 TaxID=3070656 RepID=UPI0027DCA71B|nr:ABC transporter ATP-binding protein [Paludicola sp. MB14-C6]WMJ24355.1 ABC transporter ATP-binding protein [Paludicola sp. MB14-C6]
MDDLIVTENVCKFYQLGDNEVIALDQVNIKIQKGEFVAIVGSSGSGKSTLMNVLGCLDTPTSGRYFLEGIDIGTQSEDALSEIRNKKIGFIFQSFNLVPNLTAIENVELPLIYRGVKRSSRRELSKQALTHVGLEQRLNHLPSQMSGGQQQRVAIARAIAARPPIILADEPTGNLDKKSGVDVMDILLDLNKEGKTIILITHDTEIAHLANRQIQMSDGKIVL